MSYLPLQVRISWTRPLEIDDIESIVIYKYHKKLSRCEDYIDFGTKVVESQSIVNGSYVDELDKAREWHYAVFAKNAISMAPCVIETHKIYPDEDFDGIEDSLDPYPGDQDNDGIEDECDADHPRNKLKSDNEGDGIIDECDPDDDDDGILDTEDLFPFQYNRELTVKIGENEYKNEYPDGAQVGIIASANETDGDAFLGWEGEVEDSSNKNTSVIMDKDKIVSALFGDPPPTQGYILDVQMMERKVGTDENPEPVTIMQAVHIMVNGKIAVHWSGPAYAEINNSIKVDTDLEMELDQPDNKLPFRITGSGSLLKIKIPYGSLVQISTGAVIVTNTYYIESYSGVQTIGDTQVHDIDLFKEAQSNTNEGILGLSVNEPKCNFIMPATDTSLKIVWAVVKRSQSIIVSIPSSQIIVPSTRSFGRDTPDLPYSIDNLFPIFSSTSGLRVTYISSDEDILTINNDTGQGTVKSLGMVDVYAVQGGNEEYYSTSFNQTLTIKT